MPTSPKRSTSARSVQIVQAVEIVDARSLSVRGMKTFNERLKSGEITDLKRAAELTGYSEQHLRRLCNLRQIAHVRRNRREYFFTKASLRGLFTYFSALA